MTALNNVKDVKMRQNAESNPLFGHDAEQLKTAHPWKSDFALVFSAFLYVARIVASF
jgi:hypothetical protein